MIGEGLRGGSAMEQQRASAGKAAHKFQTTMIKDILGRTYTGNRTLEGNKWAVKPVLQIAKGFKELCGRRLGGHKQLGVAGVAGVAPGLPHRDVQPAAF